MMIVTVGLTIALGSSARLASAYGVAVSMTMMLTTILLFIVMRRIWKWNLALSVATAGVFFCIDAAFLGANCLRIMEGGWIPLALAASVYFLMIMWHRGADAVTRHIQSLAMPLDYFRGYLLNSPVARVPGTAVFLTHTTADTPPIIIWHVVHNRALHSHVVALTLVVRTVPWVAEEQRLTIETLDTGFWRVTAAYGFMEKADIPELLRRAKKGGCDIELADVTYYVGHETILPCADGTGLPRWQTGLYAFMQRNATQVSEYLNLPRDAVVELNRQIEI
jgi:KUP system potassium uptake protein